jgi:hypothetical protein
MKPFICVLALAALGIAAAGCGKESAQTSKTEASMETSPAPAAETGEGQAVANVVPGSYEDWCDEHGVAESACTRCDPSLIPAFKAVNDWDEEHGLPMSQCLKHNPNLKITRPPKPEGN